MTSIASSDIVFVYSVKTGSAGDTTASSGAASLGKYASTTALAGATFDDISAAENAASAVDYRVVFLKNNHATNTLKNAVVYISAETSGGASIALAADNIAASAKGSSSPQATELATETTTPSGVGTFSSPTTSGTGVALGNIGPGQVKGIVIRRTAANTVPVDDSFTLGWWGETEA